MKNNLNMGPLKVSSCHSLYAKRAMVKHVTLLQARCSAVFLCESCSARSAFALLTITSATCKMVKHQKVEKSNSQQCVCVPACALTHGVGLSVESGHH